MKIKFGNHTLITYPDPTVEPGHQQIAVIPGDIEGASILFALTGNRGVIWGHVGLSRLPNGKTGLCAPHDDEADRRLVQLVDLCADLRFTAPEMLQLRIEGVGDD